MCTCLSEWRNNLKFSNINARYPHLQEAVDHQDFLGWKNFIDGKISMKWEKVQNDYLVWLGENKLGK